MSTLLIFGACLWTPEGRIFNDVDVSAPSDRRRVWTAQEKATLLAEVDVEGGKVRLLRHYVLNYLNFIGGGINPRIRSTNLITQMHATLAGAGLCMLPVFIARDYPALVPVLPNAVSLTRAFFMHIHEDNRKSAHVRTAAAFISTHIQQDRSIFEMPDRGG